MRTIFAAVSLASFLTASIRAENWPQWRGLHFDGSSTEKNLPAEFSKTQNVKWSTPLSGTSAATPIIWDDHVFVSSTDERNKTLRALCLDRKTGKVLWDQEIGVGYNLDDKSNFASPSPVTDGKAVFFYYGNGDLAAFDFSGKKLWARNIQKDYGQFAYQWTYGASATSRFTVAAAPMGRSPLTCWPLNRKPARSFGNMFALLKRTWNRMRLIP